MPPLPSLLNHTLLRVSQPQIKQWVEKKKNNNQDLFSPIQYFSSSTWFPVSYFTLIVDWCLNQKQPKKATWMQNGVERNYIVKEWNQTTNIFFPTSIWNWVKKRNRTLQLAFIPSIPLTTKFLERTQNSPHCISFSHFNYWPKQLM